MDMRTETKYWVYAEWTGSGWRIKVPAISKDELAYTMRSRDIERDVAHLVRAHHDERHPGDGHQLIVVARVNPHTDLRAWSHGIRLARLEDELTKNEVSANTIAEENRFIAIMDRYGLPVIEISDLLELDMDEIRARLDSMERLQRNPDTIERVQKAQAERDQAVRVAVPVEDGGPPIKYLGKNQATELFGFPEPVRTGHEHTAENGNRWVWDGKLWEPDPLPAPKSSNHFGFPTGVSIGHVYRNCNMDWVWTGVDWVHVPDPAPPAERTTPTLDVALLMDLGTELLAEVRNVVAALKDQGPKVVDDISYLAGMDHVAGQAVELEQWWDRDKVPQNVPYRGKNATSLGYWMNHGGKVYFYDHAEKRLVVSTLGSSAMNQEQAPFVRVEVKG